MNLIAGAQFIAVMSLDDVGRPGGGGIPHIMVCHVLWEAKH